jgi:hypothetical protein
LIIFGARFRICAEQESSFGVRPERGVARSRTPGINVAGERPSWLGRILTFFRVAAGTAAIFISYTIGSDQALHETVLLLGIFIVGHMAIDWLMIQLPSYSDDDNEKRDPYKLTARTLATTPAVILGLLAALASTGKLTVVVKVAAVSLAASLLFGIVLSGLVSMQGIDSESRSVTIKFMFNITLWALALGLIGIAMGIVYRT